MRNRAIYIGRTFEVVDSVPERYLSESRQMAQKCNKRRDHLKDDGFCFQKSYQTNNQLFIVSSEVQIFVFLN